MDEAKNFASLGERMEAEFKLLTPEGAIGFGWQTQDLNPDGACGNALDADPERGARVVEHAARSLAALLAEVDRFSLDNLRAAQPDRRGEGKAR